MHKSDKNYAKDLLQVCLTGVLREWRSHEKEWIVVNDLPCEYYTIEANDKIPDHCKYLLALIKSK